jgi:hypothetical protein
VDVDEKVNGYLRRDLNYVVVVICLGTKYDRRGIQATEIIKNICWIANKQWFSGAKVKVIYSGTR